MLYAQVILPLPLNDTFTYKVPEALTDSIGIGHRVIVPFGKKHFYTGVVESLSQLPPDGTINIKEITSLPDDAPIVHPLQMRFWHWLADYYLCSIGDVFKAALPSGLKVESETRIDIGEDFDEAAFALCDGDEISVLNYVRKSGSTPADTVAAKTGVKPGVVSRLIGKGLLRVSEKLVERYRSAKIEYVAVSFPKGDKDALDKAFASVRRSPRQEDVLTALVALSGFHKQETPHTEVPLSVLAEKTAATRSIIKALADKGICTIYKKEVSRFSYTGTAGSPLPALSDKQNEALESIHKQFKEKDIVLLHGVTGSGKTEIYIHLIDYVLRQGRQALFLVPEIALTTQLTRRLQKVFGNKVVIYHSKFSDNERVDIWKRILNDNKPYVVIGARSAVFLPIQHLGLAIVDEEHEASYKQFDPAPRYNGRDAAAVLAQMHGAKVLFGSATPSIETYYKAKSGKFGLVELPDRFGNASLPAIELVDMKAQHQRKAISGYLSHRLLDATLDAINRHRQAIFFHNRRGYAPVARCKMCAFTPKCDFCDVALTYHRRTDRLVCHYCGKEYAVPTICPECKEPAMEILGYGTERIEEEIESNFRDRKILRMDLDTTRNKDDYGRIIDDFSAHRADILVGTQMVTKGLDFADVDVVGVLSADSLINFPDFRSAERAFNMIEQVSGRAGRRDGNGKVIIQTYNTESPILKYALNHDYNGFYHYELDQRRAFGYPPFTRIINIYLKHRDAATVAECAAKFSKLLTAVFGSRVSAPQEPSVARVQAMYIRKIMLKMEREASMTKVKQILRQKYIELAASPLMRGLTVYYDVDPV